METIDAWGRGLVFNFGARNKISKILAKISTKFRLSMEIDKISPPIVDCTKFPRFFDKISDFSLLLFLGCKNLKKKKNAFGGF